MKPVYEVLEETELAFRVSRNGGKPFLVAKKHIPEDLLAELENAPRHAYGFPDAGPQIVDGQYVEPGPAPAPQAPVQVQFQPSRWENGAWTAPQEVPVVPVQPPVQAPVPAPAPATAVQAPQPTILDGAVDEPGIKSTDVRKSIEAKSGGKSIRTPPKPAGDVPSAAGNAVPSPQPPATIAQQAQDESRSYELMQEDFRRREAENVARRTAEEAKIHQKYQEDRERLRARFDHNLQQLQAQSARVADEVSQERGIDPEQFWGDGAAGVGRRIGAAIAIMLGGMDSRGRGNPALAVISQAVDRNIEAQKHALNLQQENRRTLLDHYARQMKSEESAYELAKADALDFAAGQAKAVAFKMAEPEQALALQKDLEKIHQDAKGLRLQAFEREYKLRQMELDADMAPQVAQLKLRGLQAQNRLRNAQAARLEAEAGQTSAKKVVQGRVDDLQRELLSGPVAASPEQKQLLVKAKIPFVDLGDGTVAAARSAKSAETVLAAQEGMAAIRNGLQELEEIRSGNESGWFGTDTQKQALKSRAVRIQKAINNAVARMYEKGVLTDDDRNYYNQMGIDVTEWTPFRPGLKAAAIRDLGAFVQQKLDATLNTHLYGVSRSTDYDAVGADDADMAPVGKASSGAASGSPALKYDAATRQWAPEAGSKPAVRVGERRMKDGVVWERTADGRWAEVE